MKRWIHIPTLLVHGILILNAAFAINDHSDYFLVSSLIFLIIYCIFVRYKIRNGASPAAVCISYLGGALLQWILFHTGVIDVHSGAFGLGGGEFARLLYGIAMMIFCVIVLLISLISYLKK